MQIPTKIQHGEKVISTVFEKINGIIDYLNASKLRKSSGIDVRETPSGTVLELVQKSASAPQAQQSPAVASGLEATVSGGTATVEISGSTALVIKPGANIQISGGTNGELIISATGGSVGGLCPDLSNPIGNIDFDVAHAAYSYPVWLIGSIGVESSVTENVVACSVIVGGNGVSVYDWSSSTPPTGKLLVPFSFLIPANNTFELSTVSAGALTDLRGSVIIYPCI
jgi:hypothetical protein